MMLINYCAVMLIQTYISTVSITDLLLEDIRYITIQRPRKWVIPFIAIANPSIVTQIHVLSLRRIILVLDLMAHRLPKDILTLEDIRP